MIKILNWVIKRLNIIKKRMVLKEFKKSVKAKNYNIASAYLTEALGMQTATLNNLLKAFNKHPVSYGDNIGWKKPNEEGDDING